MYIFPKDIYISLMCRIFTVFSCIISIYFRDRPVDFILLCSFSKNNKMILIITHIYICKKVHIFVDFVFVSEILRKISEIAQIVGTFLKIY